MALRREIRQAWRVKPVYHRALSCGAFCPGRGRRVALATVLACVCLPATAHAYCFDPSCCFGTNGRAALVILASMMLATAFPLLGAANGGLQALLGDMLGTDKNGATGGLTGLAPGAGAGGRTAMHEDGSFSIVDWSGYPAGVPMPDGPFTLASPGQVATVQAQVNDGVATWRAGGDAPVGTFYYPIRPLELGGSATDPANWLAVQAQTGNALDAWWSEVFSGFDAPAARSGRLEL